MAIYATPTLLIGNTGTSGFSFNLPENIPNGALLQWDSNLQAFVASNPNIAGGITGASNIGGIGVYSGKNGTVLNFKEISSGPGINIIDTPTKIIIQADFSAEKLSVPGSYKIVIDNDNSTEEDAKFEIWTSASALENPIVVNPNTLNPIVVDNLYTGNENGKGYFKTINGLDFFGVGLLPGMWIKVIGASNQDGQWKIEDILLESINGDLVSTIILTEPFSGNAGYNLGGPKPPGTVIIHSDLYIPSPDITSTDPFDPTKKYKLESFSLDFGPDGLNIVPGMILELRNTIEDLDNNIVSNDGNYTVHSVIPKSEDPLIGSSIIVSPGNSFSGETGMQLEEDPFEPKISLYFKNYEISTGFYITEKGNLYANHGSFSSLTIGDDSFGSSTPLNNNDLVRKDYVDSIIGKKQKPLRYFYSSL